MPEYRWESPDGASLIELAIAEGELVVKQRVAAGPSIAGFIRALLAVNGRIPLDEIREFFVRQDFDGVHRLYMMFRATFGTRSMKTVVEPGNELSAFLDGALIALAAK